MIAAAFLLSMPSFLSYRIWWGLRELRLAADDISFVEDAWAWDALRASLVTA